MRHHYFADTKGKLVTNYELARMAKIVENIDIDPENLKEIKKYATKCKGIVKEVIYPSIPFY